MRRTRTLRLLAGLAVGVLALPFASGGAAQAIYRCDDGKGGVLYADAPCKGGIVVDLAPGKADPTAIERLRRDQKAFDERQAARELRAQAEAQAARESRRARAERATEPDVLPPAGYPAYAWGGFWPGYPVTPMPPRPPRPPRPEAVPPASYVPASPPSWMQPQPPR